MSAITKQKLLVVDDEKKLSNLLVSYLAKEGFYVASVANGIEMDNYLTKHEVDLVILDLMLPGEDGLSIGRRLHQQNKLPIIMLSARGDEIDKIIGLEIGADDYLSKPFNPRELLARIRSVLRRDVIISKNTLNDNQHLYKFGLFCLDTHKHELTKNKNIVNLTIGEFNILSIFLKNKNRVLSRDMLLEMSKGYNRNPLDRSIDICINRLRKKIESDPSNPIYLKTVWGAGYLFSNQD